MVCYAITNVLNIACCGDEVGGGEEEGWWGLLWIGLSSGPMQVHRFGGRPRASENLVGC